MWRELYHQAADPEGFLPDAPLKQAFDGPGAGEGPPDLRDAVARARADAASSAPAFRRLLSGPPAPGGPATSPPDDGPTGNAPYAASAGDAPVALRAVLVQSSPLAATLGCCLQGLSAPGVFEDRTQLLAMSLLADDVGVGLPLASRGDEFRALLRRTDLNYVAVGARDVAALSQVHDASFALPALLLALSRRSDAFGPELVGADHVLRSVGLLPPWAAVREVLPEAARWERLDMAAPSGRAEVDAPLDVSAEIVAAISGSHGKGQGERVAAGAAWAAASLVHWYDHLLDAARAAAHPEQAMRQLVRARAREGAVYHQDFALEGRPLSMWLREAALDPAPLVRALAASRLVRPGEPDRSALVRGLVGPRGKMFRVFSPDDLATISRWIDALPTAQTGAGPGAPAPHQDPAATPSHQAAVGNGTVPVGADPPGGAARDWRVPDTDGTRPRDLREAYHVLQGRALPPRTRAWVIEYARTWLGRAQASVDRSGRSLPQEWTTTGLRPWLLSQHDKHDTDFVNADASALPTREAVVDSTVQLAPLTLIDGAWLQGFTDVNLASSPVGAPLFQTYWDELGNGQVDLNHPRIYRQVLEQMGVRLPPTGSWEFARDPRLREESFRLPVYWLCLGKLPDTFRPEVLGLNLAMELSGVGGSYRSARAFLRHHGFSTRFVDIHNTIDNVSTGHSAWAADAVDTHLRDVAQSRGLRAVAPEWLRVRSGYESLAPLPARRAARPYWARRARTPGRPNRAPQVLHHAAQS